MLADELLVQPFRLARGSARYISLFGFACANLTNLLSRLACMTFGVCDQRCKTDTNPQMPCLANIMYAISPSKDMYNGRNLSRLSSSDLLAFLPSCTQSAQSRALTRCVSACRTHPRACLLSYRLIKQLVPISKSMQTNSLK